MSVSRIELPSRRCLTYRQSIDISTFLMALSRHNTYHPNPHTWSRSQNRQGQFQGQDYIDYLLGNPIGPTAPTVDGQPRCTRPKRLTQRDTFTLRLAEHEEAHNRTTKAAARRLRELEKHLVESKAAAEEYKSKWAVSQKGLADAKAIIDRFKLKFPTANVDNQPGMSSARAD